MTRLVIPWGALASDNRRNARRGGRGHGWDYKRARDAIAMVAMDAVRGERPRYTEPVEVGLDFYPPNARRRDASNLLKCILDGMTGVVYKDDSLVKSLSYLVHPPDGSEPRVGGDGPATEGSVTRAEWDAMGARERDALVAEKVMGWQTDIVASDDGVTWTEKRVYAPERGGGVAAWPSDGEFSSSLKFKPTTTPDGMMAVVERMHGAGVHELLLEWDAEDVMWFASFSLHDPDTTFSTQLHRPVGAPTAPEAVCLAALTALGHMEAE